MIYLDANEQNGFLGMPDENVKADIIYLCSPNNPTGAVYNRAQLKAWVDYALKNNAVILFDAAYESFITHDDLPHRLFEIEGAEKVRHRVLLVLEDRRLHRCALRLYRYLR